MFSGKQTKATFKSYLPPLQTDLKKSPQLPIKKLEAKLLPGEIVVNEANFVRKCIGGESCQDDLWGKLVCTNFKVSFITHNSLPRRSFQCTHRLMGDHDIPLACVDQVVTVNDAKGKQKVLGSNQKLKFNPTELILYCKDFRIIRFRFDEAGPESVKKVCLAIAHYSHPADPQLLFGFDYVGKQHHGSIGERVNGVDPGGGLQTSLFDCSSDWDREIKRTGASEWRVCTVNQGYFISPSLPEFFVVPVSLADQDLKHYACYFNSQRIPLWCWNHPSGSALVRMSNISDPQQQRKVEQRISSAITKSHPLRSDVFKSDLDKNLPNIQDIQAALLKLRQICVLESFEESEEKWLSSLESSRWMEYVRIFLRHAVEVVYMLESRHVSVILLEKEDRDLSCVVSCLVQLMCDPHCRSLHGFQGLIQKEWVMAGHPFLDRCNHLKKNDKEESPLFLLFLNCVWQLWNQYPAAFEFTEVYLTVLGDSMWVPVFSTFLFNCPRQRAEHSRDFASSKSIHLGKDQALRFPPVWDWSQQFSLKDQTLFNNPLYVGKIATCVQNGTVKTFTHRCSKKNYSSTLRGVPCVLRNGSLGQHDTLTRRNSLVLRLRSDLSQAREQQETPSERFVHNWFSRPVDLQGLLLPQLLPSHLSLWKLYFLRWIPEAQIMQGGPITAFHQLSVLTDEIEMLQNQLRQYNRAGGTPNNPHVDHSKMYFKATSTPHQSPAPPEYLSSSFPFSPVGNMCRPGILGTPFSKFLNGAKIWLSTETLANETI
ncbi:myotubularin-related protein 10-like isoform X2 [Myxocyprinus asiaticus]|uniref:myotubularin-related protein 10-like isoform X2 n=1 Tax=Myxocyprinus asiaticus TaxID=70543 RepID=UPI002222978A|nr:myotubularin-related protein 10-like isoform X2 [Myxocyprinus asiaticus]